MPQRRGRMTACKEGASIRLESAAAAVRRTRQTLPLTSPHRVRAGSL